MQATRSLVGGGNARPRVLFIGNSLTAYRVGQLDTYFREMGYDASRKCTMGATLSHIWGLGGWAETLRAGAYDVVVVQDDLPEYGSLPGRQEHWRELLVPFMAAVTAFVGAIRDAGATPLIYMAHPYSRLPKTQHHDICLCHKEAESALSVAIAPGGLAHNLAASGRRCSESDFRASCVYEHVPGWLWHGRHQLRDAARSGGVRTELLRRLQL